MKALRALALVLVSSCAFAQTYSLAPVPRLQFLDSDGYPLAGGKIYSYAAGTSTPLATYQNATGTPNTNPVVLDSGGFASIWLGTSAYKLTAQNAAGVQQWSVDNIVGTGPGGALTQLAAANGATLVKYTASGGVTRTVADKLAESPSILDLGAKGDCVTDDTAVFQAAFNNIQGKRLHIPNPPGGCYKLTASITLGEVSSFWVEGDTRFGTVLRMFADNIPMFRFTGVNTHSAHFSDLLLDYSSAQPATNTNSVFFLLDSPVGAPVSSVYESIFERLRIQNGYRGWSISSTSNKSIYWGDTFSQIWAWSTMSGATFNFQPPVTNGIPRMEFHQIWNQQSVNEPVLTLSAGHQIIIDTFEATPSKNLVLNLGSNNQLTVQGLHIEQHTFDSSCTTTSCMAVNLANTWGIIDGFTYASAVAPPTNYAVYLFSATSAGGYIDFRNIGVGMSALTNGQQLAVFRSSAAGAKASIENLLISSADPTSQYISLPLDVATDAQIVKKDGETRVPTAGVATSSTNYGSTSLRLAGNYWTTNPLADNWLFTSILSSGTTPTSTLQISHSSSSTTTSAWDWLLPGAGPPHVFVDATTDNPRIRLYRYAGTGLWNGFAIQNDPGAILGIYAAPGISTIGSETWTKYYSMSSNGLFTAVGFAANGNVGFTITKTVKGSDGNNCTITWTGGIMTATTCP